jgi:hypothetical protein
MTVENDYLRTKDKYFVECDWSYADRIRDMFDSFGAGTYWHVRDDYRAQQENHVSYEVWLTPPELTALKITIPGLWSMSVR